jgi:enamine deaminase RidA (YjgF/YER057c/UK114 family)
LEVRRESTHEFNRIQFATGDRRETYLTVRPNCGESIAQVMQRLAGALDSANDSLIRLDVFGPCAEFEAGKQALDDAFGGALPCPLHWVEGGICNGGPIAGIHAFAVAGMPVETILLEERPVGRLYSSPHGRFLLLANLQDGDTRPSRAQQARKAFENLDAVLASVGMSMANVARTWLYNDDILDWYGEFNVVRTQFFQERGVFDGVVPASTGVNGRNPDGAALTLCAFAVESTGGVQMTALPSPLQCPAPAYGSSFSRAVEVVTPEMRQILISGTASIEPGGKTVHLDDVRAQIDLPMEVAQAILESRGASFADTTRAIAYIKDAHNAPAFAAHCAEHGLMDLPVVVAENIICRHDLLFEVELDTITPVG